LSFDPVASASFADRFLFVKAAGHRIQLARWNADLLGCLRDGDPGLLFDRCEELLTALAFRCSLGFARS
jgi:hypothetical protein